MFARQFPASVRKRRARIRRRLLLPGLEAKIVGRDGKIAANGEVGELHVRGPNVMRGYYRAPDLTAKAIDPDGWFNTGDLARFEGDLSLYRRPHQGDDHPLRLQRLSGRDRGGALHPRCRRAMCGGRPPVQGNEEVVAFVQLLKGSTATREDLMAHVAPQLTSYKRPSEIIVLDALPATSTGKILKHKLAESLRERMTPLSTSKQFT